MTRTLTVGLGERSYPIHLGTSLLAEVGPICRGLGLGSRVALVSNTTVAPLYAEAVEDSLRAAGFSALRIVIPDGEEYKNLATLSTIYDRLVEAGFDRGCSLIALGGGVVGDITGFAAATFLRGIPFVQIPTTLLAQVDSSVGGKTGVNHERGKNLIGAFYQPRCVVIDADSLDTLHDREYLSGLAEVIKYGVVLDRELFGILDSNVEILLTRDKQLLLDVIAQSCSLKASIVEQDERETGLRAVLNYGHTFGHAVETLTSYTRYTHGEAVAVGMAQAAKISRDFGHADSSDCQAIHELLGRLRLPVELPRFSAERYREALLRDKKVKDGGINFVFNRGIGGYHLGRVDDVAHLLKICGIGD